MTDPDAAVRSPTTDTLGWYEAQYATAERPALAAGAQHERSRRVVNAYYDLTGDFYGRRRRESLHFAAPLARERWSVAVTRYQGLLAEQLRVAPRSSVLDVGCGIGGPARTIARVTEAHVTGLELRGGHVARARELTTVAGLDGQCDFAQGDFTQMPFEDGRFDGAYEINSICHAPRPVDVYDEVFRVLKPGARFVSSGWCLLDAFHPGEDEHGALRLEIEAGNALAALKTVTQVEEALAAAGFELTMSFDSAGGGDPRSRWYRELTPGLTSTARLCRYRSVRALRHAVLSALAARGRLPRDSAKIDDMLDRRARSLVRAGELAILTPLWCTVARRP